MLCNYIDDAICVHQRHKAEAEFQMLFNLFEFLSIPINPNKVVRPSRSLTCMGIPVDLDDGQLSIPQEKLLAILDLCCVYGCVMSKKQLQS